MSNCLLAKIIEYYSGFLLIRNFKCDSKCIQIVFIYSKYRIFFRVLKVFFVKFKQTDFQKLNLKPIS